MKTLNIICITAPVGLALIVGCGNVDLPGGEKQPAVAESTNHQNVTGDPPSSMVDKQGRSWVRGRPVVYATEETPPDKFPPPAQSAAEEERKLAAMSDEQLAVKLSPISMYAGYEYSLKKPSIDTARQFRDYLARKARGEAAEVRKKAPFAGSAPTDPRAKEPEAVPAGELSARAHSEEMPLIIGTDSRGQQRDNLSYPWRSIVWLTDSYEVASCTAQLVGPSTATSVAHCFKPNGSSWYSPRTWAPGVDSQDAMKSPWGQWNGCYWVILPSSYSSAMDYYDFAVIEFSDMYATCNLYPGNTVGWFGTWSNYDPSSSETGYVYGYPGVSCPGSSNCNMPQIWGIGSNNMDEDGDNIDHYADATTGQSGAGLYVISGSDRYVIGSHQGGTSNIFDTWNEARRLEGLFLSYLLDYTAL